MVSKDYRRNDYPEMQSFEPLMPKVMDKVGMVVGQELKTLDIQAIANEKKEEKKPVEGEKTGGQEPENPETGEQESTGDGLPFDPQDGIEGNF